MEHFLELSKIYLLFLFVLVSWSRQVSSQSTVKYLPGFNGPLPFHLETGYVAVGESDEDQLFYYFIESEGNPEEDPLVLWLTGGPGCSALNAIVDEIGPIKFDSKEYDGSTPIPSLVFNPYSWTKFASIIFVDSPVMTGFSYSCGSREKKNGDIEASKELHEFIRKWLNGHPNFFSNTLYIAGDSYSGMVVPIVAQEIANGLKAGRKPVLNLKGYLLGNPATDLKFDNNAKIPYLHGMGIISDELYESAKKNCEGNYLANSEKPACSKDLLAINECKSGINEFHILEPNCILGSHRRLLDENNSTRFVLKDLPVSHCRSYIHGLANNYANDWNVRRALHIRMGTVGKWIRCNFSIPYVKDNASSLKYHINVTNNGYRALIYSGDHDLAVTFLGTQAWIRSLNFSIVDEWRPWLVDGQVAGFTRTYANNLTFATVKGGGHTAPEFNPKECLAMFQRWISYKPL